MTSKQSLKYIQKFTENVGRKKKKNGSEYIYICIKGSFKTLKY